MKKIITTVFISAAIIISISISSYAQQSTSEDKLNSSDIEANSTVIGGYGTAFYHRDFDSETSVINLERIVLFVGHNFGDISFFSELEVEDAKVEGGDDGGEIAFEQAYLKFNLDPNHYITAGLFIPRIGILNENHLPNSFNGNERTQVETYIIPSTWRELGIGFYGSSPLLSLNYSFALVNGLNSASFEHGSGIRGGRYEGRNASANNLAVTGALQYYFSDFKLQVSGYYGGTVGMSSEEADSLNLASGIFGTPVLLGEANIQYQANGISVKALAATISIPDAEQINNAFSNNTPKSEYGAYLEIGYDILHMMKESEGKQLITFLRYETLDINSSLPANAIHDKTLKQHHIIGGVTYLPVNNVVVKADMRFTDIGIESDAFFNLGIGFSF